MNIVVLVDSNEFWKSLKSDILKSKHSAYIQTMSFEGDSVGKELTNLLLASNSLDRRLSVDCYSKYFISDNYLYSPKNLFNTEIRKEFNETVRLMKHLSRNGVKARFINPVHPFFTNFAKRNHKKYILIDDRIAYLGGINFCDHNFYWHDMMLRIEEPDITKFLKTDFLASWNHQTKAISKSFGKMKIHLLDGYSNEIMFSEILNILQSAKDSVIIESPYLMFPFIQELARLQENGVRVTIIAPEVNNRKPFNGYIRRESLKSNFNLRLYQGKMTHLKLMLIDDNYLIAGSANFDYTCYRAHQEVVAVITDKKTITSVKKKVIEKDLKNSIKFDNSDCHFTDYVSSIMLKFGGRLLVDLTNIY